MASEVPSSEGHHRSSLLSSRILATSAFWSLVTQAIPAIVGVVTIPAIVRGLGVERFGVLTLAWMVIGYFGLFDLGLGRAVTKFAAELLPSDNRPLMDRLLWTAWYLILAIGVAGATLLTVISPWLVHSAIKIPGELQRETLQAFYLLAASIPIVVITAGFRGLLEAAQRFKLTSIVKIPTGVLTFLAPLLVLRVTRNLSVIVLVLVAVRVAGAIAYAAMCHTSVHRHAGPLSFDRRSARALLGFGAWMTISNILSPLMNGVDRFVVGAFLSVAAVAYYATPFEAVTKLLIIPSAISAVLFPAFSTASAMARTRMVQLFRGAVWVMFLTMFPITFVVVTFAPDLLKAWLGTAFSVQGADATRWLSLGVFMNSLAALPFALLQGVGRSDTTAKIHLVEVPLYVMAMILLIRGYGITGAAVAWCARTCLDMALLYWYAGRELRPPTWLWLRYLAIFAGSIPVLAFGVMAHSPSQKVFLTFMLAISSGIVVWYWSAANDRRKRIRKLLG
jgi:O-antigen/teichoic acid export membrane protein